MLIWKKIIGNSQYGHQNATKESNEHALSNIMSSPYENREKQG